MSRSLTRANASILAVDANTPGGPVESRLGARVVRSYLSNGLTG